MAQTMNQAAENKKTVVAEVKRAGEAIMIPDQVSISEAIEVLLNKQKEEEQVITMSKKFDAFIWEGCHALAQALDKRFGWFRQMSTPGFFGSTPPSMFTVNVGPKETVQVPWGRFQVPGIPTDDGYMETGYHPHSSGMMYFTLNAKMKRKHSKQFETLCNDIEHQLATSSIYKGKAISIPFLNEDDEENEFPEITFPIINNVRPEDIIFSRSIELQIRANLYTPITKSDRCRQEGIPLKRGVALVGPYGTGKTLIAQVTANLAKDHGWTYIFCKSASEFPKCVEFARNYQPAVVFCEDIDRVTSGDRDEAMDSILNTIDGVVSKGNEIVLVLTSNEVEKIHPGMLRPGRLDAVIAIDPPDSEAVQRLLRFYGGKLVPESENLSVVGKKLAGFTPAVIREVVERAKLTSLSLSDGQITLTSEALEIASDTMQTHLKLLNPKKMDQPDAMKILGTAIGAAVVTGAAVGKRRVLEAGHSLPTVADLLEAIPEAFAEAK